MESLKATMTGGMTLDAGTAGLHSATGTLLGSVRGQPASEHRLIELDETLAADVEGATQTVNPMTTQVRTTVLPRRAARTEQGPTPVVEERPRFHRVRVLGEGAIGTVELARDNDIRRTVAVKKLKAEVRNDGSLLRFADEVRIVGQLEHPNIVPIYDVGRDETGDVYLVMKHLEGDTMETVIERLKAGDPAYLARFPVEFRAHLFLAVVDAVRYAHARGVIHRDLKPANIMIGPYGEVTVMDWGIAKPISGGAASGPAEESVRSLMDSTDQRLLETKLGALAGTPFYMSPEQAAGLNEQLDERSDVYALGIVFYEWLTLHHPLAGKKTLLEVIGTIVAHDYDKAALMSPATAAGVPIEFVYLAMKAIQRDRNARLPSSAAFHDRLKDLLDGHIPADCPVTFAKGVTHTALRWVDRHPQLFGTLLMGASLSLVVGVVLGVVSVVRAFL